MFSAADLFFKAVFGPVFILGCLGLVCLWYDYRRDYRFYSVLAILFTGFFWRFALGIATARYALFFVLPFAFLAVYGMRRLLKKPRLFWAAVILLVAGECAKISISAVRNSVQRIFFRRIAAVSERQAIWFCTQDIGSRFAFYSCLPLKDGKRVCAWPGLPPGWRVLSCGLSKKQLRRAAEDGKLPDGAKVYLLCRYRVRHDMPPGELPIQVLDRTCLAGGDNPLFLLWGEYTGVPRKGVMPTLPRR